MTGRDREIREAMTAVRRSLIHAWSMRGDEGSSAECILSALADVQSVLDRLDDAEKDNVSAVAREARDDHEVCRTARKTDDDEIRGMVATLSSKARPQ